MKLISVSIITIFGIGLILSGVQISRIASLARKTSYAQLPFEQTRDSANLKILILGDSTAVGTGSKGIDSVAGWFASDFPNAEIKNISHNGQRLKGLVDDFPQLNDHYNLVILQIGANDIMRLTSLKDVEIRLDNLFDKAKMIGDHVVVLHSGDVGLAPIFIWPFKDILSLRSRAMRDVYMRVAKQNGVMYVDLFKPKKDDIFLTDIKRYYSPDLLHPSGQGYREWYNQIRKTLRDNGVTL